MTTAVAHSYIPDIETLELMLTNDPRPAAIALKAASSDVQTWYLQKSTAIIDALPYKGHTYYWVSSDPSADEQEFQFPRTISGMTYNWSDDDNAPVIPEDIKKSCLEEAIALYAFYVSSPGDQKRRKLQEQGVKSFSLGKLSESYGGMSASSKWKGLHSQEAYDLLKFYISGAVRAIP